MEKTKLTKREYLGEGAVHQFLNLETGKEEFEPISSKEAYESLGRKNGWMLNPVSSVKRKYLGASYGQPKLDTPNTLGELNDFFVKDEKYFVYEMTEPIPGIVGLGIVEYSEKEFTIKYGSSN